jgi:hypothetical protein
MVRFRIKNPLFQIRHEIDEKVVIETFEDELQLAQYLRSKEIRNYRDAEFFRNGRLMREAAVNAILSCAFPH